MKDKIITAEMINTISESHVVRDGKVSAEAVIRRAKEIAAEEGYSAKKGPAYTMDHMEKAKKEFLQNEDTELEEKNLLIRAAGALGSLAGKIPGVAGAAKRELAKMDAKAAADDKDKNDLIAYARAQQDKLHKQRNEDTELEERAADTAFGSNIQMHLGKEGSDAGGGVTVANKKKSMHLVNSTGAKLRSVTVTGDKHKDLAAHANLKNLAAKGGHKVVFEGYEQELEEGKLPDWAQAEFDAAFKKKASAKAAAKNSDDDVSAFNPKTDGKYKAKVAPKPTRVNRGTYGRAIIDHDDEHHAGEPTKNPHTTMDASGAINAFGLGLKKTAAQNAADAKPKAPVRPRGAGATPAAMAEYRKQLRAHQMKKESYVFDGEDFVLSESVEDNIVLDIIKEGLTFSYAVSFGEDVLKEGVGVTKQAIIKEAHEFMIKKTEEVMLEETQVDRVIDIVKSYVTEGAKSSVRAGFDAKEHADRLFRHSLWKTNHYDYGLRSAQKRKDKGTFDSALNQKMGVNLSKLGDSRLGTKLNAAEHRAVGEHIAKQIESDIDHK